MKTRVFISKAITSIVCIDRYTNLLNQIFEQYLQPENYFISNQLVDNNYLHGILQVLGSLVDKHKIFQYISFEKFIDYLKPLIRLKK